MRRFSTILLYVTIAFLLLWQLPWCYNFFVVKPEKTPFTLYSFVIGDFAQMGQEEGKGSVRRDLAGNIYSEAAFDSILPMFYPTEIRYNFIGRRWWYFCCRRLSCQCSRLGYRTNFYHSFSSWFSLCMVSCTLFK